MPETFLVSAEGIILYKHVGPFTPDSVRDDLMPAIDEALSNTGDAGGT